jgi:hypothetical protein
MSTPRNDRPQAAGNPNLWDMLAQVGFPPPQQLLQELQRFNANVEQMAPDVHRLAGASESISRLASAVEGIDPAGIQRLTKALEEASRTSAELQQRLWGK